MAISVNVPKDLSGLKRKVALNFTKRQLICFGAGAMVGVPAYFLTKGTIGTEMAALLLVAAVLPFFFAAMYEKDGYPAEKIAYFMLRQKILRPGLRKYRSQYDDDMKAEKARKEISEIEGRITRKIPIFRYRDLDAGQKKRLRELKASLRKYGRDKRKMDTPQKSIPFRRMYKDGICHVKDDFYTKMVAFEDVNYKLLDPEEKLDMIGLYSRVINFFGPEVKFQICLFNRKVNERELTDRFIIASQEDGFDSIREEYSQLLKNLSTKGNNGIIKSKYIIFGTECKKLREARSKLGSIEEDLKKNLANLGTEARGIKGRERISLLHEYFNQYTMDRFDTSYEEMKASGHDIRDFIAPPSFDFRDPRIARSGRMYARSCSINIIAPKLTDELVKNLLDIDSNLTVSMHMESMDQVKAIKMLKGVLTDIQKVKIDEQKKAVRGGWDMDILPPDIVAFEKDVLELLGELNSSNQKIIHISFIVTAFGRTRKELDNLWQSVTGIVEGAYCGVRELKYLQEQALMASAPLCVNETGQSRMLTTKSAAILIPFNTQELFQDGQALYYGLNALSKKMIMADRKKLRTPNGVILGTPGSGKSFSAKREILGTYLMTDDDILVCDPEGEYFPLVSALGGQVVRLATTSTDFINPMDIQMKDRNDREELKLKSDFIITLCDAIAGGDRGLQNDEKGIIDECIRDIYDDYFENPVPENMPILEDLYNALLHYDPLNVAEELAQDSRMKAVRIANSLVLYVKGSQNYFNHRSNVDSNNRVVCYDIRDLGVQLKELGMLIVQDAVWNRVSRNREEKKATRYYCDEFHVLLRDRQTATYSVEIWKRFRKWGGIPTGITQNVGDFLRSTEIEGILGNSDFVYLLNQNAKDQEILADKLGLSQEQLQKVTNSERGCGLILFDRFVVPFRDKYPTNTETFRMMNTTLDTSKLPPPKKSARKLRAGLMQGGDTGKEKTG